uniref:Uncharacterized protein n=1 Tax=Lactuca sativa TaxID=4236 RepID=A0A9R1WPN4_LACSA|nr:hypothetical protein LSAT_V11C100040250 [Lactuca sativa]
MAFGVLKIRFSIIRSTQEPFYSCKTQLDIFLECYILHNFLIGEDRDKDLKDEVLQEELNVATEEMRHNSNGVREETDNEQARTFCITGKKSLVNWTKQMDATFVDAMGLNKKLNMNLTKSNLKNRLKSLTSGFSQYNLMYFGVFKKSKPEAVLQKTKKVANFEQMLVLFARDRASGENVEIAKERNVMFNKTTDIKIESILDNDVTSENQRIDDDEDDTQVVSPTHEQNSSAKKSKTNEAEPQPQPKPKTFETKIMNVVGDEANAMRDCNTIFERAYHHELTGDEIYQKLQLIGLEPYEISGALMYLTRNQADARMLFTYPMNIQNDLLKTMMGAYTCY